MTEQGPEGTTGATAEVRLPRPPGVLRRWLSEHPRAVDITIVVCYVFGVGLGILLDVGSQSITIDDNGVLTDLGAPDSWVPPYLQWPWVLLAVARVAVVAAALLLRRRYPLSCLIAVVVVSWGYHGVQAVATGVALLFMLYAVPVYRSARAGWLGYGIAVVGTVLQEVVTPALSIGTGPVGALFADASPSTVSDVIGITIMTATWYLVIVMIAINLGNRRRYLQAIIDRAHQLAIERDQRAQLAVAEERSRIAREMHDIVAHSVSVMIALSEGAARTVTAAPEAAAEAMSRSAETGRTALAEMRRLLGALHDPEQRAELAPQPGVDALPELVAGFRDAGLDASLDVRGASAGDRGQELAIFRIVQEGLTNVLRYAGVGARARVTVSRDAGSTVVEVRDWGPAAGVAPPATGLGSGRGLAGLAERVRVFGGVLESGTVPPGDGPGWRLWARIPVGAATRSDREARPAGDAPREADHGRGTDA